MMISSEKANKRAAAAVDFAKRHQWAKYPCVAAVSVIYSAEFIRLKALELGERIRASASAPFRPLGKRLVSMMLSGAMAFMTMPFAAISAYAEEAAAEVEQLEEYDPNKELPKAQKEEKSIEKATTPEEIADLVFTEGLATSDPLYDILLNIPWLDREVTARFSIPANAAQDVQNAFARYGISTDELDIAPVDVTLYANDTKKVLGFREGYSADISLRLPDYMVGNTEDIKIVRLEDDGTMSVIDGIIEYSDKGRSIIFNTDHFSIFAIVAYKPIAEAENVSSGAGATASGVSSDISYSTANNIFDEDRKRYKKTVKRRVFRIKRIFKEGECLL